MTEFLCGGLRTTCGKVLYPSTMWVLGLSSGHETCQQVLLHQNNLEDLRQSASPMDDY